MSQLLTPASLDDLLKERPPPIKKSGEFTKTQKNYSGMSSTSSNEKVATVLKSMQEMDDDDATTYLGNFNPPPTPSSAGVQRTVDKENFANSSSNSLQHPKAQKPEPFTIPQHNGLNQSTSPSYELNKLQYAYHPPQVVDNYYQQVVPNYKVGSLPKLFAATSPAATKALQNPLKEGMAALSEYGGGGSGCSGGVDGMLVEKLNYMIHLLEEKQDVKTNSTIEEIIMYCFLGIFIIFIVDSFSRVGKYVR
jgi:hypothetical protein